MRKRPFLLLACMFLLGIMSVEKKLPVLLVPAVLVWLYAAPWKERGIRRALFAAVLPLMFFSGMFQMHKELAFRQSYMQKLTDGQEVRLAGKITRIESKTKCDYYYLTDCVAEVQGGRQACNDVIAYVSGADHSIGQILTIQGTISLFTQASNEGMFDAQQFYQSQKTDFGIWVTAVEQVHGKKNRYACALQKLRSKISGVLEKSAEDDGVLSAMLLGEKGALDAEIKSLYQRAGIAHILAISGLHISLLGIGLYRLLRRYVRFRYVTAAAGTALFLVSYELMTGNGISTQRAVGMCFFYLLADVAGHAYDMLNALGAVALVLLIQNPFLTGYSGFWFSVAAVISIGIGQNLLAEWNPVQKKEAKSIWQKQKEGLWISLCIQLFTLPLVAYNYYEVPVYAMAVNFFVLAAVEYLLGLTVLGVFLGLLFPTVGQIILMPGGWILHFYRRLCQIFVELPGAQKITGKPDEIRIFLYYMGLGMVLFFLYGSLRAAKKCEDEKAGRSEAKKGTKRAKICLAASAAALCMLLLFPGRKTFEIDFLDVGQGDGIYLCTGDGVGMFIDGGSTDVNNVGQYRILPFLKAKGVNKISYWFVSHTDADHISGLEEVLHSGYCVEHLIFAKAAEQEEKTKELAELARKQGTAVHYMKKGDVLHSGNAAVSCMYPKDSDREADINDRCLVLRYEEGNVKAFFGGDISTNVEEQIAEEEKSKGNVQIFKADHHGSRYANGKRLLDWLQPQISVASAGRKNRYGHPSGEAVERIEKSGSRFYNTAREGRIRIRVVDKKLVCEPCLQKEK